MTAAPPTAEQIVTAMRQMFAQIQTLLVDVDLLKNRVGELQTTQNHMGLMLKPAAAAAMPPPQPSTFNWPAPPAMPPGL